MILLDDIIALHERTIEDYGGAQGIRDSGLLESAIARPFQTFEENDLYPTFYEKAAALCESLIKNHPFIDGNKRTGIAAMYALLLENNTRLVASPDKFYSFAISISTGSIKFEQIVIWLKENSSSL